MGRMKDAFLQLWGKDAQRLEDDVSEQEERITERRHELQEVRRQQRKARLEYLTELRAGKTKED